MKSSTQLGLYVLLIVIGSWIGLQLGIGVWAASGMTWYQFNVITGIAAVLVGIYLILKELEEN